MAFCIPGNVEPIRLFRMTGLQHSLVLSESPWVQIEPSAVEIDGCLEIVDVGEPAALSFDRHDVTVEPFAYAVGDVVPAVAHHVVDPRLEHVRHLVHWRGSSAS
jgi:hypothetical protein